MGHHVVHLLGQTYPFLRTRLFGQQVLLALGPFCPIGERDHEPSVHSYIEAKECWHGHQEDAAGNHADVRVPRPADQRGQPADQYPADSVVAVQRDGVGRDRCGERNPCVVLPEVELLRRQLHTKEHAQCHRRRGAPDHQWHPLAHHQEQHKTDAEHQVAEPSDGVRLVAGEQHEGAVHHQQDANRQEVEEGLPPGSPHRLAHARHATDRRGADQRRAPVRTLKNIRKSHPYGAIDHFGRLPDPPRTRQC